MNSVFTLFLKFFKSIQYHIYIIVYTCLRFFLDCAYNNDYYNHRFWNTAALSPAPRVAVMRGSNVLTLGEILGAELGQHLIS